MNFHYQNMECKLCGKIELRNRSSLCSCRISNRAGFILEVAEKTLEELEGIELMKSDDMDLKGLNEVVRHLTRRMKFMDRTIVDMESKWEFMIVNIERRIDIIVRRLALKLDILEMDIDY